MKKLIELGLDILYMDINGYICIFEYYRNVEGLIELINVGCDINYIDKKGMNIFFMFFFLEVLFVVIDVGCNVN